MKRLRKDTSLENLNFLVSADLMGYGMHCVLRGIVLPAIKQEFDISYTEAAILNAAVTAAYFVMTVFIGAVTGRIGYKRAVSVYMGGLAATSLLIALSMNVGSLIAFFFLSGICYGGLDCCVTAIVRRHNREAPNRAMNKVTSSYCLGCLFSALLGGWFVKEGLGWRAAFLVVAAICLAGFLYSLHFHDRDVAASLQVDFSQYVSLLHNRPFLLLCLATALFAGLETASNNWMMTFLSDRSELNMFESACITALYFFSVFAGRELFGILLKRFRNIPVAVISCLMAGCIIFLTASVRSPALMVAAIAAFGVSLSGISPLLVSVTSGLSGENAVYSFIFVMVSIANLGINFLIGIIADLAGMSGAFRFNALLFAVVALLVFANRKVAEGQREEGGSVYF